MNSDLNEIPVEVFLWGAIGQTKLIRPVIEHYGSKLVAIFEDRMNLISPYEDIPIYYGWDAFMKWSKGRDKTRLGFCVSLNAPRGRERLELHDRLIDAGFNSVTLAHPSAMIEKGAMIGPGSQLMAGTVIGPEVRLGKCCIVNTKASVDHDGIIGDGAEISPGATLCGMVTVGENVWIGAGATILPGVKIGPDAIVGAGAVVNRDVAEKTTVVGVPAKPLTKK